MSRNCLLPFLFTKQYLLYQKHISIIVYLCYLFNPIRPMLLLNLYHGLLSINVGTKAVKLFEN
jgi:hypothetical protein